jgi:hypothetical protein
MNDFKLNIEHKVYYAREKECPQSEVEEIVNRVHVDGDGYLSSVLSTRLANGDFEHFFIFHERIGDAIYTVMPFSERSQRQLELKD